MRLFTLAALLCLPLLGAAAPLQPGAKISLEFPDLPPTLHAALTGEHQPATLTAVLPENYTPAGRFPLFIYLEGDTGGTGQGASVRRDIPGGRDFITVSLPLFKDPSAPPPTLPAGLHLDPEILARIVNLGDSPLLARSYRTMLGRLQATIPNITTERSALGGFSNGAHATAALLAGRDPWFREHFESFFFIEGGLALLQSPEALRSVALPRRRLLFLFGDKEAHTPERQAAAPLLHALETEAKSLHLDFTLTTMHGYGHEEPSEYLQLVGRWVRGEAAR